MSAKHDLPEPIGDIFVGNQYVRGYSTEQMLAAIASYKSDALRYRWLRDHFLHVVCCDDDTDAGNFTIFDDIAGAMLALDAHIDAALGETK
jgi:hypothetical protein